MVNNAKDCILAVMFTQGEAGKGLGNEGDSNDAALDKKDDIATKRKGKVITKPMIQDWSKALQVPIFYIAHVDIITCYSAIIKCQF